MSIFLGLESGCTRKGQILLYQRLRQVAADSDEVRKLLAHIDWMRYEHYLFLRRGRLLPHRVVAFTEGSRLLRISPFSLLV